MNLCYPMDPSLQIVELPTGGLPYEERGTMFGLAPRLGLGWRGEKTAGDHAPLAEKPGTVGKGLKMGNDTYIVYTYIHYIYI